MHAVAFCGGATWITRTSGDQEERRVARKFYSRNVLTTLFWNLAREENNFPAEQIRIRAVRYEEIGFTRSQFQSSTGSRRMHENLTRHM